MSNNDLELLKILNQNIQSEAKHGTSRNSYFLVVTSILILSLSQFDNINYQIIVSLIGCTLCITWFLMHLRSSKYISYWKQESRKIVISKKISQIYPIDLGGFEIRILGFFLPTGFFLLWLAFLYFIQIK